MLEYIYSTKIRNNIEEAPFGVTVTSTEPEYNFRVKLMVDIKIIFMVEIYRYSCD